MGGERARLFRADDEDTLAMMGRGGAQAAAVDTGGPEDAVGSLAADQREAADEAGDEGIGRRLVDAPRGTRRFAAAQMRAALPPATIIEVSDSAEAGPSPSC